MDCTNITTVNGCKLSQDGSTEPVLIHTEYGLNAAGKPIVVAVRYTSADGTPYTPTIDDTFYPGPCDGLVDVEISTTDCFRATAVGTGYSTGDVIRRYTLVVADRRSGGILAELTRITYVNETVGPVILEHTAAGVLISGDWIPAGDLVICTAYTEDVDAGAAMIAGTDAAATPPFIGAVDTFDTATVAGRLQSITVTARGVLDGLSGVTAHQVVITAPDGSKISMLDGESRTYSVVKGSDGALKREFFVAATGTAYAVISWTVFS